MRRPLPNALDIDFAGGANEEVTPHAGVALLVELGRRSGLKAAATKYLPPKKAAGRQAGAAAAPRPSSPR